MNRRKPSEAEMRVLEKSIPALAAGSFQQASLQALATRGRVLIAERGELVELTASGERRVIKPLPQPVPVDPAARRVVRKRR